MKQFITRDGKFEVTYLPEKGKLIVRVLDSIRDNVLIIKDSEYNIAKLADRLEAAQIYSPEYILRDVLLTIELMRIVKKTLKENTNVKYAN